VGGEPRPSPILTFPHQGGRDFLDCESVSATQSRKCNAYARLPHGQTMEKVWIFKASRTGQWKKLPAFRVQATIFRCKLQFL
jgi:hypothetical protein